ncbi:AAA family ATPase [Clostridium luticellarii]|uniref:AAA family ATPase n=1 Tax=Clostridium luticellarii TaxID=1691940 RepID=UPI001A9A57D8|nr:MoxR family ATPase [Clostridium luticellarii]MCI1968954.1 MoxR family ATPase [Clostridium luticellarii]MCI1996956.1 MoxR family ATPase [Clostridium luticellarii]
MRKDMENIIENISKVVVGKKLVILDILEAILAEGHVLIEDVPGVGKTMLVKALSKSLNLNFSRIQLTPDILPSDILGVSVYNPRNYEFNFKKGPIFANMVLVDEINRALPRTQSALIEVMEEGQITDGNNTYLLDAPFMVMATENPLEYSGTFQLPEAVLDRFMIKISLGYPTKNEEIKMLSSRSVHGKSQLDSILPVMELDQLKQHQEQVGNVHVSSGIYEFIVNIVQKTRSCNELLLGASPRASIALLKISKAAAYVHGRNYVVPDDVKENIKKVLSHRIILSKEEKFNGTDTSKIIDNIMKEVAVPDVKYA